MATTNDNVSNAEYAIHQAVALVEMARETIGEICTAEKDSPAKAFKAGVGLDEALPKLKEATRLLDGPGLDADEARSQGQYEQMLADRFEDLQGMLECENLVRLPTDVLRSAVSKANHLTSMLTKALESDPGETSESYAKACNLTERLEDLLDGISPDMNLGGAIEHLEAAIAAIHEATRQ